MDEIKLIIIKIKNKLFSKEIKNNKHLDIHLRIFCIKENYVVKNIKLVWGYQTDEKIIPLENTNKNEKNLIKEWEEINNKTPGLVKGLVLRPEKATHFIINYMGAGSEKTITQPITKKTDLLPNNATDFERVLALTTARLSDLAEAIISPFDIEKTPKQILPWLAWLFSVDDWYLALDTKSQRSLIANSVKTHRKKGTKASIKEALKAFGGSVEVKEWWEEKTKIPALNDYYQFTIYLNINNTESPIFTDKYYQKIKKRVDNLKPVSTNYNLALKANAEYKAGVVVFGYILARLSLFMELKS